MRRRLPKDKELAFHTLNSDLWRKVLAATKTIEDEQDGAMAALLVQAEIHKHERKLESRLAYLREIRLLRDLNKNRKRCPVCRKKVSRWLRGPNAKTVYADHGPDPDRTVGMPLNIYCVVEEKMVQ